MEVIIIVIVFAILFVIVAAIRKSQVATLTHRSPKPRVESDVKEKELEIRLKFEDSNKTEGRYLIFDITLVQIKSLTAETQRTQRSIFIWRGDAAK